jgi:hypothetical protein
MKQNISLTVTVGAAFDRNGNILVEAEVAAAVDAARLAFCQIAGGCTVTNGRGSWVNAAGELVSESVRIFTVLADAADLNALRGVAVGIKDRLNQECVAFAFSLATVEFI